MSPETSATDRRTSLLATLALLAMTACWGSTFFLIKDLLERVPTLDFLAVRFAVAAAAMLLVAPRAIARLSPAVRRHAVVLGVLYGAAQILQTAGLAHTPASVSGFITGMYIVLTPVFAALILRTRIGALTWAAVALAAVGLAVLTLGGFSLGYGEAITLVSVGPLRPPHRRPGRVVDAARRARHVDPADPRDRRDLLRRDRARRHRAAGQRSGLALAALHGDLRRRAGDARPDLGAGTPVTHALRDHHEHGAGLRGDVRRRTGWGGRRPPDC